MSRSIWNCLHAAVSIVTIFGFGECQAAEPKREPDPYRQKLASIQKILNTIPKDLQPKVDGDPEIQLIKANEWLAKNFVGKQVDFKAHFTDVKVIRGGDDRYQVQLWISNVADADLRAGTVRCGGADWRVVISADDKFWKPELGEADYKQLQKLRGKDVTIVGNVSPKLDASRPIEEGRLPHFSITRSSGHKDVFLLRLGLHDAQIKDILPKSPNN
jgi:hypothetical protein